MLKILATSKKGVAEAFVKGAVREQQFATMKALNRVAKMGAAAGNAEAARSFDRPRLSTTKAVIVRKLATYRGNVFDLEAIIQPDDYTRRTAAEANFDANRLAQGKSAVPPSKYLQAQIAGGPRVPKRFEIALQRAGILPKGMYAVFAKRSNALDAHGNLPGSKITQILSYFQAFPEQGYRMNMKARSKQNLAQGKRKGMRWGMAYFVGGREAGLPNGIYERHYPTGMAGKSFIRPVLIFVTSATYRARFDYHGAVTRKVDQAWPVEYGAAIAQAKATRR